MGASADKAPDARAMELLMIAKRLPDDREIEGYLAACDAFQSGETVEMFEQSVQFALTHGTPLRANAHRAN